MAALGGWDAAAVADWLLDQGHLTSDINALCEALGRRLAAAGAPLARLRLSMRLLHPQLAALSAIWQQDGTLERDRPGLPGMEGRDSYRGSPLAWIHERGEPFRRRLEAPLGEADHRVLHELRAQGASDYLAMPLGRGLGFGQGGGASAVFVTARAGGFDAGDLAGFARVARPLAPVLALLATRALAQAVAEAYVGRRSGRQVLAGRIRRGEVERLTAAIWFSDLRGWSALSNRLPAEAALAYANAYFELVEAAVSAEGGEVLKLIGDAVLAIFPVEDGLSGEAACRAALTAAASAQAAAAAGAGGEAAAAGPEGRLAFGIGLHVGPVVYGNVGAPARLDFTVMGEAVNRAARLEALCRPLQQPVVLSAELAAASGLACRPLGSHAIKGWDQPVAVYAPPEG